MAGGRPTKYKPEYVAQAAKLCKLGATTNELADFFQVSTSTVCLWQVEYKEFSDAIKMAKDAADRRVEQSLFNRAMGYTHDEVDIRTVALGDNQGSEIVQTPIKKHYAPDPTAMIFWLKNRKPGEWRDRVEHTGADGGAMQMEFITTAALKGAVRGTK